jgi:FdhD protein
VPCNPPIDHSGSVVRPVSRLRDGTLDAAADSVAVELPVALVFNGISHAVMMATPLDLEEFAIGFSLTEGIVDRISDVFEVDVIPHAASIEIQLTISQGAFQHLKGKRRALAGRTGCGVCGIESIELLDLQPEKVPLRSAAVAVTSSAVERAVLQLPDKQHLMKQTGGVHAAAWCLPDGTIAEAFEDVGRHNALDKLIGRLMRRRIDLQSGFVFLSSRASYELVRKSARVGIPMLATISAPTSLAIQIAQEAGIRLLSFCRRNGFVEYTATPVIHSLSEFAS